MENIQWIFSGLGTTILSLLLATAFGGVVGYKIGIKKSYIQSQEADDNSKQIQVVSDNEIVDINNDKINITTIEQYQNAGKNSEQIQVGRFKNEN